MPAVPSVDVTSPGVDWVPITLSGDNIDLTSASGPTGGIIARSLYVETGGVVKFDSLAGQARGPTMGNNSYLLCNVKLIYSSGNGTTASGIWAIL